VFFTLNALKAFAQNHAVLTVSVVILQDLFYCEVVLQISDKRWGATSLSNGLFAGKGIMSKCHGRPLFFHWQDDLAAKPGNPLSRCLHTASLAGRWRRAFSGMHISSCFVEGSALSVSSGGMAVVPLDPTASSLLPVVGVVRVGPHLVADRHTYVPLIGLFIMMAWGVPDLFATYRHRHIVLGILMSVMLSGLTVCAWRQVGYWRNSRTLSEHALDITTNNWRRRTLTSGLVWRGKAG
jgi:hypothetical protein